MVMDVGLLILIVFDLSGAVLGGLVTFSDSCAKRMVRQKQYWGKSPEARNAWSDEGWYRYNRYGLGLGTFIMGIAILISIFVNYLQH
jgi:hypothetical protein